MQSPVYSKGKIIIKAAHDEKEKKNRRKIGPLKRIDSLAKHTTLLHVITHSLSLLFDLAQHICPFISLHNFTCSRRRKQANTVNHYFTRHRDFFFNYFLQRVALYPISVDDVFQQIQSGDFRAEAPSL